MKSSARMRSFASFAAWYIQREVGLDLAWRRSASALGGDETAVAASRDATCPIAPQRAASRRMTPLDGWRVFTDRRLNVGRTGSGARSSLQAAELRR